MFSRITLAWLSAFALIAGAGTGCRDNNTGSNDMGIRDLGGSVGDGGGDMSVMRTYTDTTPHAIDTATETDPNIGKGRNVKLTGVVATTPVYFFKANSRTRCDYEVWVQDPDCSTEAAAPCGIVVTVKGPALAMPTDDCPFANNSGTLLATVNQGDNLDITGRVDWFPDFGTGANPLIVQHEVEADSVTKRTGTLRTVTPIVLSDGSGFVTRMATASANAWNQFEATLIAIDPPGATKLQVTTVDTAAPFQFHTTPGNSSWGTNFRFNYRPRTDGGSTDFPIVGDQFTSIAGVVSTTFGGALLPTRPEDFVR